MPIGVQLAHAGRKASTEKPWDGGGAIAPSEDNGSQTLAPSAIAYDDNAYQPKAMTKADITQLINDFVSAAKRADELGLDLIELHGAHGYCYTSFYRLFQTSVMMNTGAVCKTVCALCLRCLKH